MFYVLLFFFFSYLSLDNNFNFFYENVNNTKDSIFLYLVKNSNFIFYINSSFFSSYKFMPLVL